VEAERDGVGGVDGLNGAKGVAVSPDGENVYVAAPLDDAVAVFARDAATGALSYVEVERHGVGGVSGLAGADDVAPSPDGAYLYVIAQQGVVVFGRSPSNGALSFIQQPYLGAAFVSQGSSIAVSPDGSYLLATGPGADELVVFWCDPATGLIGLAQRETDGVDGASGLLGAVGVALDARNAYVAGGTGDAIAIFAPEPLGGALGGAALLSVAALRRRSPPTGRRRGSRSPGGTSATPRP
jgi:6-phosphogluconolactonase (cycloisomerase 2 family)